MESVNSSHQVSFVLETRFRKLGTKHAQSRKPNAKLLNAEGFKTIGAEEGTLPGASARFQVLLLGGRVRGHLRVLRPKPNPRACWWEATSNLGTNRHKKSTGYPKHVSLAV